MSEFECACGSLILPSRGRCEMCGGRAVRMDGYSNRELAAQERAQAKEEALEENYGAMGEERCSE